MTLDERLSDAQRGLRDGSPDHEAWSRAIADARNALTHAEMQVLDARDTLKTVQQQARGMSVDLAERIADALFTAGNGEKAWRLALKTIDERELGGWGREPAIRQIRRSIALSLLRVAIERVLTATDRAVTVPQAQIPPICPHCQSARVLHRPEARVFDFTCRACEHTF